MKAEADRHDSAWSGVWIAIPAYQEAATIRGLAELALEQTANVILVDDGSTDGTAEQLRGLPVTLLVHPHNRGKEASLRTAFAHALSRNAECVITMDGDGQHDPADAAMLLAAWRRDPARIVIGSRLHDRSQFPVARWRANRFACFWISWAAGHPIADSQSGFRAYPAAVMRLALGRGVRGSRFTFESEVLIEAARHGHRTIAVAIPGHYPVNARRSHFRPVWDITKIVLMVAGRLLRSGMAPVGLWRSLRTAVVLPGRTPAPRAVAEPHDAALSALDLPAR
jgi:glycosyltransferase involved in cell wall biosynthesis